MPQIINTNIASLNAQRNLNSSQSAMQVALQRLSSGLRINSARDDAAGLAISERMSAQITSLNQGIRNANDGISMIQTAESALDQIQTMMQRMRELAVQASSDTVGATERGYANTEVQQLQTEINNIANRTKFNGNSLLTGALATSFDTTNSTALVGTAVGAHASVTSVDVTAAKAGSTYTLADLGSGKIQLSDGTLAQTIDISAVAATANQGTAINFDKLGVSIVVTQDATGENGTAIATGLDTLTVKTNAGVGSATLQIGADYNANNQVVVSFGDARLLTTNSDGNIAALRTALDNFNGTQSAANAGALLSAVDNALNSLSTQRAGYGAAQNRLTNAVSSLTSTAQNLTSAKSQITDADFAAETASMTRAQVLQQAGVAMLAQANAMPNNVLALLKG